MRPLFGGSTRTAADDDETEIETRATQELERGEGEWSGTRRRHNYTPPPIADDGDIGAGTGSFFGLDNDGAQESLSSAHPSPPQFSIGNASPRGEGAYSRHP